MNWLYESSARSSVDLPSWAPTSLVRLIPCACPSVYAFAKAHWVWFLLMRNTSFFLSAFVHSGPSGWNAHQLLPLPPPPNLGQTLYYVEAFPDNHHRHGIGDHLYAQRISYSTLCQYQSVAFNPLRAGAWHRVSIVYVFLLIAVWENQLERPGTHTNMPVVWSLQCTLGTALVDIINAFLMSVC